MTHLKLWPIHGHMDTMCVGPPPQVFLVICILNCMVELRVDLRQSASQLIIN